MGSYEEHEAMSDKWLESCPVCEHCGKSIQDEYYYEIGGDIYCEDCLNDEFRHETDIYIEAKEWEA